MSNQPDAIAFRRALDPAPSAIERGAPARLHWRSGLATDSALAAIATDGNLSPEWSAVLAETHARLLDPSGVKPLATPSPIGAAVGRALEADPSWPGLVAAASLHPVVARETVSALAPLVRRAVVAADAAKTDSRRALADLQAARARLAEARAASEAAKGADAATRAEALREAVAAGDAEQRASAAYQQASAAADRVEAQVAGLAGQIAAVAAGAADDAAAIHAVMGCGLGHALGAASPADLPSDVVALLTPEVARILTLVGALQAALREGRDVRHLPGREGMLGPDVGGLDRIGDARPVTLAGLAGTLGKAAQLHTLIQLARGRAAVVEKGGGRANDGHVVLVVDQSGSMQGARAVWATALTLAMLLEAQAQGRHAVVVTFAGGVRGRAIVDGPTGLRAAFALVCRDSDGNDTNVRAALDGALDGLQDLPRAGKGADVVLVTDGVWSASEVAAWPTGADAPRLQAVLLAGNPPAGLDRRIVRDVWTVDAAADVDGGGDLAVQIARTIV